MAATQLPFHAAFVTLLGQPASPRHCEVIGSEPSPFVSLEVLTAIGTLDTRTSISGQIGNFAPSATLDWVSDGHFGTAHIHGQSTHMGNFIKAKDQPNSRSFDFAGQDGVTYQYVWSRIRPGLYMLYVYVHPQLAPSHIATYQHVEDPQGRTFGNLNYGFVDAHLFLHVVIALVLNLWGDQNGFWR